MLSGVNGCIQDTLSSRARLGRVRARAMVSCIQCERSSRKKLGRERREVMRGKEGSGVERERGEVLGGEERSGGEEGGG